MKTRRLLRFLALPSLLFCLGVPSIYAQYNGSGRPRTVNTDTTYQPDSLPPVAEPTPYPAPPLQNHAPAVTIAGVQPLRLPYTTVRTRLNDVLRYFKSRSLPPSAYSNGAFFVTLAAFDPSGNRTHYLTLPKQSFVTKNVTMTTTTSLGKEVNVRVVRVNGVNTAVLIYDQAGRQLAPLAVEYPIDDNGRYRETAYYISAHPALLSPELTRAGQIYIRNTIQTAAGELSRKGINIDARILDIAERLCNVEHVDHDRFKTENKTALFHEVYSLYALNEGETYRYAISTAAAGGMIQMIPATYAATRRLYPNVSLQADFMTGMRNHANAAQVMLLYMQSTWNDLNKSATIRNALASGKASMPELMAAGYNSNPTKLAGYISRSGNNWRTAIPNETKMYLQIYSALESSVPVAPRNGGYPDNSYPPANNYPPSNNYPPVNNTPALPPLPAVPGTRPRTTGNGYPQE